MSKLCCFFDPERDYSEKELSDRCPKCNRTYGFVLENKPIEIINDNNVYSIIKAVGRGFYGATYLSEVKKRFKKDYVLLKIIPVNLYKYFGKNFEEECNKHAEVADHTEHLVKIEDAFDADVCFGTETIKCHVAVLQYINGYSLFEYIQEPSHNQPKIFAQIAIDLLKLWNELVLKGEYHNDLHLGNLMVEQLDGSLQRVDAIYDRIRLVGIDLNSISDRSLSDSEERRIGDRKYISKHISMLSQKLRDKYDNIDEISDTDFRLIESLNKIARILSVPAQAADIPEISELIEMIKEEFKSNISYSPWKRTFMLSRLNDGINAQTLPSCYVPQLLVDPENTWIEAVSVLGPQLITGMRGCGKTMLLAALDIHARLASRGEVSAQDIIGTAFEKDRYIGIMTSCRELVDIANIENQGITKLILLYTVQIIRAVRHIRDINSQNVKKDYHKNVAKNLGVIFDIQIEEKYLYSDTVFERYISDCSNRINVFCEKYKLQVSCINAFELIADSFVSSSDEFRDKQVFFLLDDASTRYVSVEDISSLLTKILFISPKCAFKVTTEAQTLYSFKSPGNIEMSQDIRDYQIFDLGADVFNRTREPQKGKKFIDSIIKKRWKACNDNLLDYRDLETVLGDCSLKEIASYIMENTSSAARKTVYYGATALSALCVGDIGDIVFLYDSIISYNEKGIFPVEKKIQTQCFQQLCSRRMYNLERKDGTLRAYVRAFSEASYKCLMDSKKAMTKNGSQSSKIRQYNGLYIRMTSGNIERQQEKLRRLIDSGIFVYADGNGWPRSKSGDTDPITQIKLAFRKLFGVSNFIGLGNSDRYELSGEALEQWLEKPNKEILLRNLGNHENLNSLDETPNDQNEHEKDKIEDVQKQLEEVVGHEYQLSLFDYNKEDGDADILKSKVKEELSNEISERVKIVPYSTEIVYKKYDIGIFGLGFEERCFESVKRVLERCSIDRVILVQYDEQGYSDEIKLQFKDNKNIQIIQYDELEEIIKNVKLVHSILIDVTGLYKPIIFDVVRKAVMLEKKITIVHTYAQDYYPLNSDIEEMLKKKTVDDATRFADLMRGLTTGDEGEYFNMRLLGNENYDPIRPIALVGFVSPKNQRIFSILDKTEYESVNLFIPIGESERDILSQTAGNIAMTNYIGVRLKQFETSNPDNVLKEISRCYAELYIDQNYNFEIALTGTKMQTVAAAVFSAVCKVSQCWYVKPSMFDTNHFTKGIGDTLWYTIDVNNNYISLEDNK